MPRREKPFTLVEYNRMAEELMAMADAVRARPGKWITTLPNDWRVLRRKCAKILFGRIQIRKWRADNRKPGVALQLEFNSCLVQFYWSSWCCS
jgi:hypothetical protein